MLSVCACVCVCVCVRVCARARVCVCVCVFARVHVLCAEQTLLEQCPQDDVNTSINMACIALKVSVGGYNSVHNTQCKVAIHDNDSYIVVILA